MSSIARWSYTNVGTIWPASGTNEWGEPAYSAPYTIACSWMDTGSTQTDETGTEFVPASTFWFESAYTAGGFEILTDSSGEELIDSEGETLEAPTGQEVAANIPRRHDYIAKFDRTDELTPPTDAQRIQKVTSYDMSPFGADEIPDWEIFT